MMKWKISQENISNVRDWNGLFFVFKFQEDFILKDQQVIYPHTQLSAKNKNFLEISKPYNSNSKIPKQIFTLLACDQNCSQFLFYINKYFFFSSIFFLCAQLKY